MGLVHAEATLTAKPQADTMQHTVLPTMHRLSSVTHMHTHSPLHREGAGARPAGAPRRPLQPHTHLEVAQSAVPPWRPRRLEPSSRRPQRATPGRDQPAPNKGCEQAAGAACIPAPRRGGGSGGGAGAPGGSGARSLRAARSEGAPAPALPLAAVRHRRRCPATAPHTSIIHRPSPASRAKPITGGGSANGAAAAAEEAASRAPGRKRQPFGDGDGDRGRAGGRGRTGRAGETSHGRLRCAALPDPAGVTTQPACRRVGPGAPGKPGARRRGGGEGGGAREDDERRAALCRRLRGALPAPRAGRPHPRPAARSPQPAARSPHSLACAARQPSHFTARD
nr:translation initiation factor IF-2-like [Rattus norvegicus]XP_038951088.1 translation initiation factor IF-2-like [Rattus norvegicus]